MQIQAWIYTTSKTLGYWSRRASIQIADSLSDTQTWGEGVNVALVRAQIALRDTLTALGISRS